MKRIARANQWLESTHMPQQEDEWGSLGVRAVESLKLENRESDERQKVSTNETRISNRTVRRSLAIRRRQVYSQVAPEIPGKGAAVGQDFNQTMCLGNRVGPGSLSGPAHFRGLKILLSEEDKGRAKSPSVRFLNLIFKIKKGEQYIADFDRTNC